MQNRFGIKDFFLFLLIAGLIVAVIMAMVQFDRQYDEILTIKQQNSELTRDLVQIKRQIAEGVPVAGVVGNIGGSSAQSPTARDQQQSPFRLIREAEKKQNFARGDWYVDNFGTKIGKLTPLVSSDIYQMWVERQVTESLAWRDPYTLEYVPLLASGWEISEDGLTMRFQLRRGVTFSDGEPFDADDVIYSFDLVRNSVIAADRTRSYLTKLKDVKKIDPYTVEFTFTEPYFLNFGSVAENVPILPEHFYSRFTADQFNEKTGLLMGTGPYRLENPESWTPGQLVALLRNDRYWGEPAAFNRIVFHEIQEEAPQMVLYGNQEHDVIRCTPEQYIQLTTDERVMKFSNKYSYQSPFKGYIYVGWNQLRRQGSAESRTFFADKRVRQAMTMLLDRERMNKEIFRGFYSVASGPFAPNGPQAAPDLQPWPHAPERAMALLKEAGFADRDGNGVLENEQGEPFRFTLTYPSGSEAWEKFTLFAKDGYARAGILMVPDRVDWPVLVQRLNTSDFEAVTLGWSSVVESDPYQVFHSDSIKGQGDNRIAYRSLELDRAIDTARTTMDKEKRMKLWHEVHRILHEDQPYTFLFNRPQLTLMNSRIQNVEKSKLGLNFELLNGGVMPWFVPEKMQRYTQ